VQVAAIEQQAAQTFTAIQDQIAALGEQMAQIAQMMAEKETQAGRTHGTAGDPAAAC